MLQGKGVGKFYFFFFFSDFVPLSYLTKNCEVFQYWNICVAKDKSSEFEIKLLKIYELKE